MGRRDWGNLEVPLASPETGLLQSTASRRALSGVWLALCVGPRFVSLRLLFQPDRPVAVAQRVAYPSRLPAVEPADVVWLSDFQRV